MVAVFFFAEVIQAQNIKGIATYKTQRKFDVQMDSTQMDDAMQAQIKAMMRKQFEKEYTLEFTKDESLYKEVEKLGAPNTGNSFVQVEIVGEGGNGAYYKNLADNKFINQTESFSRVFLINDTISKREWKLGKETKNIGNYTCFKATSTYERTVYGFMNVNDDADKETTEEEKMETVTITAWYTPQIPVKNGPSIYDGLPGLILEVNDGQQTMLCSKVVLNPEKGIQIKKPKEGQKVTQVKYDQLMEKKMKEMEEQFHGDGRRGGDQIEIRIGG